MWALAMINVTHGMIIIDETRLQRMSRSHVGTGRI
jgi:hypothetical protein